jgi:L-aspartate oxidase
MIMTLPDSTSSPPTGSGQIETDVLILGSGIAGGIAALKLASAGVSVVLVTRADRLEESNTVYAQGGIVCRGKEDSAELLVEDIVRAGGGLSNQKSAEILARRGPELVDQILIKSLNVPFDRTPNGDFSRVLEGGHAVHRILHAADATGNAIEKSLVQQLRTLSDVTVLTQHTAVDLLTPAHHSLNRQAIYDPVSCVGAYVLDQASGIVRRCLAKNTILATGGLGQLFLRTTNSAGARGDGLAMAYRAGARSINCEFIQFHPTAFFQEGAPCFLISEAVRGAGAKLVHADGEPFMQKYDPEWKDLSSRDLVSRSIHTEMLQHGVQNVYLDLRSNLSADLITTRFPAIYRQCKQYGIDITKDLIPVVPAAHYFCGGVWVDEWGKTTLQNLYAVGEVACTGVHGANRLPSTSLLEGLVWGHQAASHILSELPTRKMPDSREIPLWQETGTYTPDPALLQQDLTAIRHIMWNYVGLVRTNRRLQRALRELRHLENEIERFYHAVKLTDPLLGLRNAVQSALIVTIAAWENKSSLGCHYREN